jgi:hypothetical protein
MTGPGTGAFQFFVAGSDTVHPVMWITWLNLSLVLCSAAASLYFSIWGRSPRRGLMIYNFALCLMVLFLYALFFVDIYWVDILSKTEVSLWIVKPLYTIIMAGFLTNILAGGRRQQ